MRIAPGPPIISRRVARRQDSVDVWLGIARAAEAFEATRVSPGVTMWDHRQGHRGAQLVIPRPTALTEESRQVFSRGHCHSLALAFAERGFQVYGVVSVHTLDEFVAAKTSHYFAVDASEPGFGWDAYGYRPIGEITAGYVNTRTYHVSDPDTHIAQSVESGVYLRVDLDAGRLFVKLLTTDTPHNSAP